MKIIFNCHGPFALAHGGVQVQIEQTRAALEKTGVTVEYLRWWDENQSGDILHHFGRIPAHLLRMAQQKGMKVVFADFMGGQGARSPGKLKLQRFATRIIQRTFPRMVVGHFNWESYKLADACLALTQWEAHLMSYIFGAPAEKIHVVPNGVEEVFFAAQGAKRGPWLVCTATINAVKRVVELAQAAVLAQTPLWVVGKPYAESDPCAQQFFDLSRRYPRIIRYEGPVQNREQLARVYREARGFVLLSAWESLSLSALEAAACECPLLLSDLPWARTVFGESASYCPITPAPATAGILRQFYDAAPSLKPPPRPLSWLEVGQQLKNLYESLIKPG